MRSFLGLVMEITIFFSKGLTNLFNFILSIFYNLVSAVLFVIEFTENLFKSLAGIDVLSYSGGEYGGTSPDSTDLLFAFLTSKTVQDTFFNLLGFSVVMLVILTIVAMVKAEFTLDVKSAAKGPILSRSFKALLQFFMVPAFVLLGVVASNALTKVVYSLSIGGSESIAAYCFKVGAYSANRVRNDEMFYKFITSGYYLKSGETNPFASGTQEEVATYIDVYMTGMYSDDQKDLYGIGGTKAVKTTITNSDKTKYVINTLDFYPWSWEEKDKMWNGKGIPDGVLKSTTYNKSDWKDTKDSGKYYAVWHDMFGNIPTQKDDDAAMESPYMDATLVNYFYDMTKFNFVLAIGCGCVLAWTLLSVCLALLKRVFEMTILFMLSPAVIALAPLDGGKGYTSWRGEIFSRLFAVVGPLFAFNIFFALVSLISNVTLFTTLSLPSAVIAVANIFFQTIAVIVGASMLKSASKFIASFLGIKDLLEDGGALIGKAGGTLARATMVTAGVAAGGVMAGRMAVGAFKGTANLIKTGYQKTGRGSDEYKKMKENKSKLRGINKEMKALERSGNLDDADSEDSKRYTELTGKKSALAGENAKFKGLIKTGNVHNVGKHDKAKQKLKDVQDAYDSSSGLKKLYTKSKLKRANKRMTKADNYTANHVNARKRTVKAFMADNKLVNFVKPIGTGFGETFKDVFAPQNGWRSVASRFAGGFGGDDNPAIKLIGQFGKKDGRKAFYQSSYEKKQTEKRETEKKEKKAKEKAAEEEVELAKKKKAAEMAVEKEAKDKEHAEKIIELLKQFAVHQMGESKEKEYKDLLDKRKLAYELGDNASIDSLNAQINKFETDNNVAVKAQNAQQDIVNNNNDMQKAFEDFKEELRKKGEEDAKRKLGIDENSTINVKNSSGGDIKVSLKNDNEFAKKLGGAIGNQLSNSLKNVGNLVTGMKGLQSSMGSVASGQQSMVALLEEIRDSLDGKKKK